MPDGSSEFTLKLHKAIAEIPARRLGRVRGDRTIRSSVHAFLSAVEDSGSATARTGWLPQHAVLRDGGARGGGRADVREVAQLRRIRVRPRLGACVRAGGRRYYPKLQVAVPFSPVPGPRLLVRPDSGVPRRRAGAGAGAGGRASWTFPPCTSTFCTRGRMEALGEAGWLQRIGMQFHWTNDGYATFDDFLAALSSRKRKTLRRERRDANSCGLEFSALRGAGDQQARVARHSSASTCRRRIANGAARI